MVAQNTDLLGSDFRQETPDNLLRLSLCVPVAVKVRLLASDGSAVYLKRGRQLTADTVHHETLALDCSRSWKVQMDDAAGLTWGLLSIVEIGA